MYNQLKTGLQLMMRFLYPIIQSGTDLLQWRTGQSDWSAGTSPAPRQARSLRSRVGIIELLRPLQCLFLLPFIFTPAFASSQKPGLVVRLGCFGKCVDYAPYLVARRKHLYESALRPFNATVSYHEFETLPAINEAFASNKVDVVYEADTPYLIGRAAGIDLKILEVYAVVDIPVMVPKNSSIKTISELREKKVAVLAGTGAHYVLIDLLKSAGLAKNDLSIVDMSPPDAKSAFENNRVDAWATWPPFIEQEELSGMGKAIPGRPGKVIKMMVTRSTFIANNPAIVKVLLDILKSTKQWVTAHPLEAQKIVSEELKVPLPVVERAWTRHSWKVQLDVSLIQDLQNKANFLKSAGFIRHSVNVKDLL